MNKSDNEEKFNIENRLLVFLGESINDKELNKIEGNIASKNLDKIENIDFGFTKINELADNTLYTIVVKHKEKFGDDTATIIHTDNLEIFNELKSAVVELEGVSAPEQMYLLMTLTQSIRNNVIENQNYTVKKNSLGLK